MKTFRRYLLSYLLTLFLPVGILSIVISQIVLHYCANQLLDNNAAALRQLDTSVSMQVTQFNAYAIQTTQRTEFSRRKLEKAGGFYDAQRTLLQWQITNTLMDNVYFFNTEDDPVYAYNMVNSGEKVYRYRLAAAGFNKEKVMQLLDGNAESPWLAAQNDRRSALLYAAYDALQWLHKLYAEGLMNQEYFTEDYQQFLAKGNSETCITGLVLEWYIDNIILKSNVKDFAYMEPVEGPNGTAIWSKATSPNSPQGTLNGFTITTACKNPELLVKWYDYINSNLDILNLWNYGPEGVIWRYIEDGRWELFNDNVPEGSSSSLIRRTLGTGPTGPVYAYSRFRGPQAEKYADRIAAKVAANEACAKYIPAENIPNGFGDAEEETERNMLLTDIDHYLDQFKAHAVVDGITEEEWQDHLKTLGTLSIDEYVDYWQSYYDSHK